MERAERSRRAHPLPPRRGRGESLGSQILIVAVAVLKGMANFGQFHLMARAGQRTASRLRRALLHAVLGASPAALERDQTGEILSRFVADATAVEMAVTYPSPAMSATAATAALLFGVCLLTDWRLSLLACAALPLTLVPLARLLKRLRRGVKEASLSQGALGHLVAEGLQGLPSIQVDGLEERETQRFHRREPARAGEPARLGRGSGPARSAHRDGRRPRALS